MNQITIQQGDNLELLKQYPDNYFDSVVTDAPYGLGKEPDAMKLLRDWIDHDYHVVTGRGFMGRPWDAFVPQPNFWKEVFRVLKPGGYLLCFFGTRTYDWGTMAIRLAGFEIRDMITWHYGSGFPKSLDVSKAIDKSAGAVRKVVGKKTGGAYSLGTSNIGINRINQNCEDGRKKPQKKGDDFGKITVAATDEAKKYEGWGTALKPATEPICVARKPISGTVSQNMIKFSTGGINIDACRIDFENEKDLQSATYGTGTNIIGGNYVGSKLTDGRKDIEANTLGRFPANVILDPFMADVMDEQSGILTSGYKKAGYSYLESNGVSMGKGTGINNNEFFASSGGASRFFYSAKASQDERNAGCERLAKKDGVKGNARGRGFNEICVNTNQRMQECKCGNCDHDIENHNYVGNNHPTVKPISVMRWLQRLVTPVGGLTLDPFAGSGTSGCAAAFEVFNIVLMEAEAEYIPIIEARTKHWQKIANREKYIQELKDSQTSLFSA